MTLLPIPVAARSAAARFESHRRHGYLYLVSVVCCHVEVEPTLLGILLVRGISWGMETMGKICQIEVTENGLLY